MLNYIYNSLIVQKIFLHINFKKEFLFIIHHTINKKRDFNIVISSILKKKQGSLHFQYIQKFFTALLSKNVVQIITFRNLISTFVCFLIIINLDDLQNIKTWEIIYKFSLINYRITQKMRASFFSIFFLILFLFFSIFFHIYISKHFLETQSYIFTYVFFIIILPIAITIVYFLYRIKEIKKRILIQIFLTVLISNKNNYGDFNSHIMNYLNGSQRKVFIDIINKIQCGSSIFDLMEDDFLKSIVCENETEAKELIYEDILNLTTKYDHLLQKFISNTVFISSICLVLFMINNSYFQLSFLIRSF